MHMIFFALSILPIVLLFFLMIILRMPTIKAMPIAWIVTLFILVFYWNVDTNTILASNAKATLTSIELIIILLGAIFLLETLKQSGFVKKIEKMITKSNLHKYVAVIVIGWSFVCLIEGAAGFGTPAALSAPLIASIGISPVSAVAVTLIADSTAVSFGALGAPINIGIADSVDLTNEQLHQVSITTALIHSIIGIFIPFVMMLALAHLEKKPFSVVFKFFPFCIMAGLSFVVPYFIVAYLSSATFPSLIGGLFSLAFMFVAIKYGWLIPKTKKKTKLQINQVVAIFGPYALASAFLVFTKIAPISDILSSSSFVFENIFGTNLSYNFSIFTNPGVAFFISAIITAVYYGLSKNQIKIAFANTCKKGAYTFVALIFTVGLVQMFLNSTSSNQMIPSMPMIIAQFVSDVFGGIYIFASAQIGLFGSFLAGSNTVSNIFFAQFQQQVAVDIGISAIVILALQVVGGAAGNMIAIHNIIAASATVGLKGEESKIILTNAFVAIGYALLASLVAMILIAVD